jgi:hypothetical protein
MQAVEQSGSHVSPWRNKNRKLPTMFSNRTTTRTAKYLDNKRFFDPPYTIPFAIQFSVPNGNKIFPR